MDHQGFLVLGKTCMFMTFGKMVFVWTRQGKFLQSFRATETEILDVAIDEDENLYVYRSSSE
jgi:hypothetical protein